MQKTIDLGPIRADRELRDQFIKQNKNFILSYSGKVLNHYVTDSDEEWSFALSAFDEAIDSYKDDKGSGFYSFAMLVIKRRLFNHLRGEARYDREISAEPSVLEGDFEGLEEPTSFQMEVRDAVANDSDRSRHESLTDEIDALEEDLTWYPIDFFDLESVSPKAEKTKEACGILIKKLAGDRSLYNKMRQQKSLPVKELLAGTGIHKKIPERHRKFIIASAEIMVGDYPILQEYLSYIKDL